MKEKYGRAADFLSKFPRTRVFLDEEELQLSERCKTALAEIKEDPVYTRLQRFYKLFGKYQHLLRIFNFH